jgi:four helix bundle protein
MSTINSFEDLEIWVLARLLYNKITAIVKKLRLNREYRFADQMKSSSGSIMDNIAEGFERNSRLEFLNSLSISKGESGELKSQLYRCLDDGHIMQSEFNEISQDITILSKKLASLMIYLNKSAQKGLKFKNRS